MGMLLSSYPWIHTQCLSLLLELSTGPAHPPHFGFPKARNESAGPGGKTQLGVRTPVCLVWDPGPQSCPSSWSITPERGTHLTRPSPSHLLSSPGSKDPTGQAYSGKWQFWKAPTLSLGSIRKPCLWKQCLHCQHRGRVFTVTAAGKEKSKPNDYSVETHCKVNRSCNPEKWLCLIWLFSAELLLNLEIYY